MKKIYAIISVLLPLAAMVSCETLSMDEQVTEAPVITSFAPLSAPVGAEVTVNGEYLNNVTEAYIGDVKVTIATKVSDKLMTVKVATGVTSGRLRLVSINGEGISDQTFSCSFAVPDLISSLVQNSAELGEKILLTGHNLNSVKSVAFRAEGSEVLHEAEILTRNDDEMTVSVPYVENETAHILLSYFDGENDVYTEASSAPSIKVIRRVPTVTSSAFARTAVGKSVTLSGSNLNNVENVFVGETEAPIVSKSDASLTFTVPAGNFEDGETVVALKIGYFAGNESKVIADKFAVYVPFVKYWENVSLECQSQNGTTGTFTSFFSPESGKSYANYLWATELDPLAMSLQGSQFASANTFKEGTVSEEQYNSVLPYFFFSVVSKNQLQLNSPANSNSQLKNFMNDGTINSKNRVPGTSSSPASGTPILAFRCLNAGNAAEAAVISKVVSGELENIDEKTFPIDLTGNTIGGIAFSSAVGGAKHTTQNWPGVVAPSSFTDDVLDLSKSDVVIMVAYYSCNGFNKENTVANILRLGFVHLTKVDWIVSNGDFRGSQVLFNCYWQKYDYDYSKIN